MILSCNSAKCRNTPNIQNELHGQGRRVMNLTKEENTYRCTVCSEKTTGPKNASGADAKETKKASKASTAVAGQRQSLPK